MFEQIFGKKRFEKAKFTITELTAGQKAELEEHYSMEIPARDSGDMLGIPVEVVYSYRKYLREKQKSQPVNTIAEKRIQKEEVKLDFEIQKLKEEIEMSRQELEMRKLEFEKNLQEWREELSDDEEESEDLPDWLGIIAQVLAPKSDPAQPIPPNIAVDVTTPNTENESLITSPTESGEVTLTDEQIMKMLDQIPKKQLKMAKLLPDDTLKNRAREMFPHYSVETLDRAVWLLKNGTK